ncbi:MAG TPA: carboxypeptidase regulatory-like domain-containing protein [Gemmatimonadaceae bacterium]|nr:carboxypeptidase regulatory-like domain-containing protein [Gemmatimonadaceae bacterium]
MPGTASLSRCARKHWKLCLLLCATVPAVSLAQTIRVSGQVVDETSRNPIQWVTVRLSGSDSTQTTGPSGTFSFAGVLPGRVTLTAAAYDREFVSASMTLISDTVLTIVMKPRVVTLDPMIVRPGFVRISGTVFASNGDPMLFAYVGLHPDGRYVDASNAGSFKFDKVATGPVTIVVEAIEHLPLQVTFTARRDTTLRLKLEADSVALRMIANQVVRLADRAEAEPYTIRTWNRELIERERRATIGETVDRMMVRPYDPGRRAQQSADDACVFLDDRRIAPGMLDGLYPELMERIEVYRNGAMIRVYSKRYVMSLVAQANLPKVTYIPTGLRPVCG